MPGVVVISRIAKSPAGEEGIGGGPGGGCGIIPESIGGGPGGGGTIGGGPEGGDASMPVGGATGGVLDGGGGIIVLFRGLNGVWPPSAST